MSVNSKLPEWYECIEEPLKELIYFLRNAGFNTVCSCGHFPRPYIQMEWGEDSDMRRLWNLLAENGYINWSIKGFWRHIGRERHLEITFYGGTEWNDKGDLASISDIHRNFGENLLKVIEK